MAEQSYWLVKQEPSDYPWSQLVADGKTVWTGVRNYQARNHLRAMQVGDEVAYYHSGEERAVVGVARVVRAAYPDPTADEGDWSCVELAPVRSLERAVTLAQFKADAVLKETVLVRHTRLSVLPLTGAQFRRVLTLGSGRGG